MSSIKWKYVSPIIDSAAIDILQSRYHYTIPEDLKECITENNAGMPIPSVFDTVEEKGRIFGGLLSLNKDDVDNIYEFIDFFVNSDGSSLKMFPFGLDPFGNFYCVQDGKVVFYDHETESVDVVANTFTNFLGMLHD